MSRVPWISVLWEWENTTNPLLCIQKCHATSSIIRDLEEWEENLRWAVWLMQTQRGLMGWQLLGLVGWMSSKTRVILYGVYKAVQVCLLLWNSLSWDEQVTLSLGFASLSSQKNKLCTLESADGDLGGIKRRVKCISQATGGKQKELCFSDTS